MSDDYTPVRLLSAAVQVHLFRKLLTELIMSGKVSMDEIQEIIYRIDNEELAHEMALEFCQPDGKVH